MQIHVKPALSQREAYDFTQCSDAVNDGDIIVCADAVAVVVGAYPVHVSGPVDEFHTMGDGFTLDTMQDGRYAESARIAALIVIG